MNALASFFLFLAVFFTLVSGFAATVALLLATGVLK